MGMASFIDEHGVHLFGCECEECTATNATCPVCGREYYSDPDRPELEECPRCMWTPMGAAA